MDCLGKAPSNPSGIRESFEFLIFSNQTRIIGDSFRSAVVSTASVGVPPTEPVVRNRPAFLVSSQAHR